MARVGCVFDEHVTGVPLGDHWADDLASLRVTWVSVWRPYQSVEVVRRRSWCCGAPSAPIQLMPGRVVCRLGLSRQVSTVVTGRVVAGLRPARNNWHADLLPHTCCGRYRPRAARAAIIPPHGGGCIPVIAVPAPPTGHISGNAVMGVNPSIPVDSTNAMVHVLRFGFIGSLQGRSALNGERCRRRCLRATHHRHEETSDRAINVRAAQ